MKQPKKLTLSNEKLLGEVGMNPAEWMNYFEDNDYLHVICKTDRAVVIIDKKEREITRQ